MLMEHYVNGKATGIIEPNTEENQARAVKWNTFYVQHFKQSIELTFRAVVRKKSKEFL